MKDYPIKVLQKLPALYPGGIAKIITDYHEHINKEVIQFDYLVNYEKAELLDDKIKCLNGHKYSLINKQPLNKIKGIWSIYYSMYKFLKNSNYQIIHISDSPLHCLLGSIASCFAKIPVRIVHSHTNAKYDKKVISNKLNFLIKRLIPLFSTHYFACSKDAAEWMFPNIIIKRQKYIILKNAINSKKFIYNEEVRKQIRKELNLQNFFVIGNVGNYVYQKNHDFLLKVFYEINKIKSDARLLLIGNGPLKGDIETKLKEYNLFNKTIMLENREDICRLMQAMDVFVFPSSGEGLGIVTIEAQAASLKTICSDKVPEEANITNNFITLSLEQSPKYWAEYIIKFEKGYLRKDISNRMISSGYDIYNASKILEDIYLALISIRKGNKI